MRDESANNLSLLPGVDRLLSHPLLAESNPAIRLEVCREAIDELRRRLKEPGGPAFSKEALYDLTGALAVRLLDEKMKPGLRSLINGTGIVLHTNLGRAPLSEKARRAAADIGGSYSTLEYDPETGRRGSRHTHIDKLVCRLTGAEAALVVNNNAAAVYLTLFALARKQEVILSRGQLVEIGDSFRIPEILSLSGAVLREVGATNRTKISDYESAINENTAFLMYVHPSNFSITGFTESTSIEELCKLGAEKNIPVIADLGSGCLYPLPTGDNRKEPLVTDAVQAGCALVTFSGDKLLGGPQAGLIAGKKELTDRIKACPLFRTVRSDKLTLAALEATLSEYTDPETARKNIPTLSMLTEDAATLAAKAEALRKAISETPGIRAEILPGYSPVGGGSMPDYRPATSLVTVSHRFIPAGILAKSLRLGEPAVIAFIQNDLVTFDVRTIRESEISRIAAALATAVIANTP